jgi:PST family polysaccharide transporter
VQVAFTVNAVVATTLSLSVLIGAPVLDSFFRAGDPNLFRVIAVLVLAKGLNQVPDALLKRELAFQRRARADFTRSILRFTIATSLLLAGVGPIAMVSGRHRRSVCSPVTWWLVRFRPRLRFDRHPVGFASAAPSGARLVGVVAQRRLPVVSYWVEVPRVQLTSLPRLPELILGVYSLFSSVAFPTFSKARDMVQKLAPGTAHAACSFSGRRAVADRPISSRCGSAARSAMHPAGWSCWVRWRIAAIASRRGRVRRDRQAEIGSVLHARRRTDPDRRLPG